MTQSRFEPLTRRTALRLGAATAVLAATAHAAAGAAAPDLLVRWAEGWSAITDPAKLLAIVTDDIVYEDVAVGYVGTGTEAFRTLLAEASKAIPDFRVELFNAVATDSIAATEYAISGIQSGDLPYLKASGKSFRIRAASIFTLRDGKIARESRYYDMARFLEALGGLSPSALPKLNPPPETPPA